jgi:hypothetical protein
MKLKVGTKVTVKESQMPYYYGYGANKDYTKIEPNMIGRIVAINVPSTIRDNVRFHCADFDIDGYTYRCGLQEKDYVIIDKKHELFHLMKNLS